MKLSELKRRESELRKRYGDDQYEKMYIKQQGIEASRSGEPKAVLPSYKRPDISAPNAAPTSKNVDNMFYTNRPDSGIITNIPSIADYRRGIEEIGRKIESLGKQQYEYMLSGDDNKVNALGSAISDAGKQRDAMRKQMTQAMGLGESKDTDMPRAGGRTGERLLLGEDNNKKAMGLDDDKNTPPPLKYPGMDTFDDYVNRDDYDNVNDYLDAAAKKANKYIKNGDKEGYSRFLEENKLDDPVSVSLVGKHIDKIKEHESMQQDITASTGGNKIFMLTDNGDIEILGEEYTFISEDNYDKELEQLNDDLEIAWKNVEANGGLYRDITTEGDYYDEFMKALDNTTAINDEIEALRKRRSDSAKDDPNFNCTGLIEKQEKLGSMPFGSQGTVADNGCGSIAAHNALVLLGEQSNYADVYADFNNDNKMNFGSLAGGKLGVDPNAVVNYLEDKGHKITYRSFEVDDLKEPGVSILVYVWISPDGKPGAHFIAADSDGKNVSLYNWNKKYSIDSGDNSIDKLPEDLNMITKSKHPIINGVVHYFSSSLIDYMLNDDPVLSGIMKIN